MLFRITKFCKAAVAVVFTITAIYSCSETKKTNRELFEDGLQRDIEAGIQPLINKGIDSTSARNCITCMLEAMYQIDSTYFLKPHFDVNEVFDKYGDKFEECIDYLPFKDSIQKVPELELK